MRDSSFGLFIACRDLRNIWLGQLLSQAGTRMYQIALAWWIVSSAAEAAGLKMGLLLMCGALPALLLAGPIGRLVDRKPGRRLLLVSDGLALAVTGLFGLYVMLPGGGSPPLALIYAVGAGLALCQAVLDPTLNKMVPLLAPPEKVEQAVAWVGSTQSIASFFGAICGAVLVEKLGLAWAVWVNAASYALAAFYTSRIPSLASAAAAGAPGADDTADSRKSVWPELSGVVRRLLLAFGAMNFFMTPILVVLPVYVNRELGGSATVFALVEAALWVGLVAGTFLAEHWKSAQGGLLSAGSRLALGSGVCLGVSGIHPSGVFLGAWTAAFGVTLGAANVKFLTYFQQAVPDSRKGRFFALLGAVTSVTFPVAFFLFGWLADAAPASILIGAQGVGIVAVGVYALTLTAGSTPRPEVKT